ncbi:hypothetical protein [uncultured Tenacibaculum sp.]|uniref:hypothetical protein n=1 Tax=uncultured Tenacibaculum sp. TaxID=174713 RepID=UPI002638DBEF|nr:hypothetical protein [uncultured Tenacibaculum sp.]
MKIKILCILFLLTSISIFSQSELYVLTKFPVNNTPSSKYGNNDCRIGDYGYSYTLSHPKGKYSITNNNANLIVDYGEGYNDDPYDNCSGPCGQFQEACIGKEVNRVLNFFDTELITYTGPDPIVCGAESCLPLSYKAVLLPKIIAPLDRRCEEQDIFPQHSDGKNHNVSGLVWEYRNKSNLWESLPKFKDRYPLNVSLLDVFGANWRNNFSGNLQLRFRFTAPFTNDKIYSVSRYTIQLTECSPKLVNNPPVTEKTTCSYSEDGTFTLTVNRNLVATEKLIATLYYEYTPNNYNIAPNGQEETLVLMPNSNGTYSYRWKGNLPPGNYKLKYQTLKGGGQIPHTDPSWASVTESNIFTVLPAEKVNFKAKKLNDENCFTSGDGKIKLEIISGETTKYKYIIYQVNGASVTLYRNWTEFTGPMVIIEGLEKKKYRIKVQDSKDCFAR